MAASIRRCTVASSIVVESLVWKSKASASRGRGDGVLLRDDLRMRSLAMSRSPLGGSSRKLCVDSETLVCCLVAGLLDVPGVAGTTSGAGGGVSAGVGVGVDAFPQKNDM